ncbi:MAG: PHB depolymerase family esterase, partial [Saprospiraceae bacterium]
MKYLFTLVIALFSVPAFAQLIQATMMHDGEERTYDVYLPDNYEPGVEWPLVFNLHGLVTNTVQQGIYTAFTAVADTANFIICHPNGTNPIGSGQGWDVEFPGVPVEVDDVGFIDRLIDTIHTNYNINLGRVYSTGMSNGGYTSYKLARDMTDRKQATPT